LFNGAFRLAEQIEQFDSRAAGQRFSDASELVEELTFKFPLGAWMHIFNGLIEYMHQSTCKEFAELLAEADISLLADIQRV